MTNIRAQVRADMAASFVPASMRGPTLGTLGEIQDTTNPLKVVYFQFNPATITLNVSGNGGSQKTPFSTPSGGAGTGGSTTSVPSGAKKGSGAGAGTPSTATPTKTWTLTKLYFDGGFHDDVSKELQTLYDFAVPPGSPSTSSQPAARQPKVKLSIGAWSLTGYVKSFNVEYQRFSADGKPTRALISQLQFNEYVPPLGGQNPTSGGLASYTAVTLGAGDSLQSVAYTTYGHARLWRQLAIINTIDDPLRVRPGTTVMLPTLTEILAVE